MRSKRTELARVPEPGGSMSTLGFRLRLMVARRAEEILAEVAPTLRRIRTFLLVATISIPVCIVALVVVGWHLAH